MRTASSYLNCALKVMEAGRQMNVERGGGTQAA